MDRAMGTIVIDRSTSASNLAVSFHGRLTYGIEVAAELAELFAGLLDCFNPKRRVGKVVWFTIFVLIIALAIVELAAG
jgi:hypothetical protein